ncbi:MAG: acyltransferase [Spirochaetota bacterium]
MQRSLTDSFKVVAAIAVVGIHATSLAETQFARQHDFVSLDFLGVMVNQWARFSVPLFIYLSAYGLAKADKAQPGGLLAAYGNFLWRRLPTILVPYVFFSAIALAMEFHSYQGPVNLLWNSIARKLITGGADYHLYFLVLLAQCYLLFPLLMYLARNAGTAFRYSTWLSLIVVSGLLYKGSSEILLTSMGLVHPGWHASFVIYWLPYFMLGILHAAEPPRPLPGLVALLAVTAALVMVVSEYIHYSWQGTPVDYYNHFSRPSVMLYALVVAWWLHSVSPSAFGTSPASGGGREGDIASRLAKLAPLTFAVYLIHPQILRLANAYLPTLPTVFSWLLVVVTTFLLVQLLTLVTTKLQEKGPGFLTGPVRFFQRCLGLR